MCSLSILDNGKQRFITMNRDEARSRHEYPALFYPDGGTKIVYPRDAQAGGTWFGVNCAGVVLALLNRYQDPQLEGKRSRGWLIPELLTLNSVSEMRGRFNAQFAFDEYNPFDLVFIDAEQIIQLSWNGCVSNWQIHNAPCFFTSSSLRPVDVIALRQAHFDEWLNSRIDLPLTAEQIVHQLHWAEGADPETAIRMRRLQTHSKSLCQVSLAPEMLALCYWNEATLNQLDAQMMAGAERVKLHLRST